MRLTPKLLGYLNRVFDKDPKAFVALRVRYAGGLAWTVADGTLTLTVTGGPGASVAYDLSAYTLESLVAAIAARTGFEVAFLDSDRRKLSALVLLDGAGDQAASNGDALLGYTSILWAFMEAFGVQLQGLRDQVGQMLRQLSTTTAEGAWLDELGSYYGVPRLASEVDALYGQRIIAETLRPVSNNVAIERAIEDYTGQPCTVVDVAIYRGLFPLYDGSITHNGAATYNAAGFPDYGLFDVTVAYDLLLGGDIDTFLATVEGVVERLRAAGTHMRALALSSVGSPISDSFDAPPSDSSSLIAAVNGALTETFSAPSEGFGTLVAGNVPLADSSTAPTEVADGMVYTLLYTQDGQQLTTLAGDPLLAIVGPLFV